MHGSGRQTVIRICFLLGAVFFSVSTFGKRENEAWYQAVWCQGLGGEAEYRLNDHARVDCLTTEYAIEMDFAHKWHEAIGQALHYARKTGRQPGIVLILKSPGQRVYIRQLQQTLDHYQLSVKVWQLGPWESD